jgi:hypothetical protein
VRELLGLPDVGTSRRLFADLNEAFWSRASRAWKRTRPALGAAAGDRPRGEENARIVGPRAGRATIVARPAG